MGDYDIEYNLKKRLDIFTQNHKTLNPKLNALIISIYKDAFSEGCKVGYGQAELDQDARDERGRMGDDW